MKYSITLSFLLIIGLQISGIYCKLSIKDLSQMIVRINQEKCLQKSGAQLAQVVAARTGKFDDDRKLKCYYRCVMEKMKMMKDGKFQIEFTMQQMKTMMEESLIEPLMRSGFECYIKRKQTEPCESAFEAVKCWYDTSPSLYVF